MERNRIEFDDTIFLNQFQNEKSSTITREYNYHNPLRIVKSLLPNVLVRKYRENPTLQVEPEIVKSQAAVLYIRILNPSKSNNKETVDPESLEFKQIRECMDFLFEDILAQGGDIVKEYCCLNWVEISCLAVWNTENEPISTVAQRAGNCAVTILQRFDDRYKKEPKSAKSSVSIKIGLDVGDTWFLSLGGYLSKWLFYIAGETVKNAMMCSDIAKTNELISAPSAWNVIHDNARGVPLPSNSSAPVAKSPAAASPPPARRNSIFVPDALGKNTEMNYYVIKSFDRFISQTVPFPQQTIGGAGCVPNEQEQRQGRFETALLCHIPKTLQYRLYALNDQNNMASSTSNAWVPELRTITVIYIVLDNVYYIWDQIQKLSKIVNCCQGELQHYGSCVESLFMDNDKTVLTAAFGLPTATFEDNSIRAITVSRSIQFKLKEIFQVRTRIGIAQGKMVYALTGSKNRYEQSLTGNVMALARALAYGVSPANGQEPNTISCDETIVQECNKTASFEECSPVEITVNSQKLRFNAFKPTSILNKDHNSSGYMLSPITEDSKLVYIPPIKEIHCIQSKITDLINTNRGGLIYIEGIPGIGKSRIATEIYKMCLTQGLSIYTSSGHKYHEHDLFYPWRSLFSDLLKLNNFSNSNNSIQLRKNYIGAILGEVSPYALVYAPLLNPIFHVDFPTNEYMTFFLNSTQHNREARFDKLRDLLTALLEWVLRQQPVVIVIDDSHWIDAGSWSLICFFLRKFSELYGLLIITLSRPILTPDPSIVKILKTEFSQKLLVPALTDKQSHDLLAKLLGVESKTIPPPISKFIAQAQGVPMYINELAYVIKSNEHISIYNKSLSIRNEPEFLNTMKIPDTVGSLINSRLDKLSQTPQIVIRVASVIGNEFDVNILQSIYPLMKGGHISPSEWRDLLISLEQQEIFHRTTEKPHTYHFTHPLICESAYSLLLSQQRKSLHAACAEYYEVNYASDLSSYYPLLAHHWKMADSDVSKLVYYLEKAGTQAWGNCSSSEVIQFFSEILEIIEKHDLQYDQFRIAEMEWALAYSHYQYHRNQKARDYLISIVTKLDSSGLPSLIGIQVSKQIAQLLWKFKWKSPPPPAIKDSYEQKRVGLASHSYRYLGLISLLSSELPFAFYCINRSVNLAEQLEDTEHLPKALSIQAHLFEKVSKNYAEHILNRAITLAQKRPNDPHTLMVTYFWQAIHDATVGNLAAAYDGFIECRKLANQTGDNRTSEDSLYMNAILQLLRGNANDSLRLAKEGDTLSNFRGSYSSRAACLSIKARIFLLSKRLSQSEECIQDARHFITEGFMEKSILCVPIHTVYAQIKAMQGDIEGAMEAGKAIYEILKESDEVSTVMMLVYIAYAYHVMMKLLEQQTKLLEQALLTTLRKDNHDGDAHQLTQTRKKHEQITSTLKIYIKPMRSTILEAVKNFPVVRPAGYHSEGLYQWYSCSHGKAIELWRQGLQLSQQFGMPLEKERLENELKHRRKCKICKFSVSSSSS